MNSATRRLFKQSPNFRQRVANYFKYKQTIKKVRTECGEDHQAVQIGQEKLAMLNQEIIKIIRKNEAP